MSYLKLFTLSFSLFLIIVQTVYATGKCDAQTCCYCTENSNNNWAVQYKSESTSCTYGPLHTYGTCGGSYVACPNPGQYIYLSQSACQDAL